MSRQHAEEVSAGERFSFGQNWRRFLLDFDEAKVLLAEQSLCRMLGVENLSGKRFLDVGSGSGLFSLAARRSGATVVSFDYDPYSVECTNELKRRFFRDDPRWTINQGSVLDETYLASLGRFEVVYAWGVLHHTGELRRAMASVVPCVAADGQLFIAVYNDQGWTSRYWSIVKGLYNRSSAARFLLIAAHMPYLIWSRWLVRALRGRYVLERGMSLWRDMIDWLGGYPFEVAKPEEIHRIFRDAGFALEELKTCGGRMGCNEFVFRRLPEDSLATPRRNPAALDPLRHAAQSR